MAINFAAIHDHNSWRHHKQHDTIYAAIAGPKGAVHLLRNDSSAARLRNTKHGAAKAAFVWVEGEAEAYAYRLDATTNDVGAVKVPVAAITNMTEAGNHPSASQIAAWFSHYGPSLRPEDIWSSPTKQRKTRPSNDNGLISAYLYGDKQTWGFILEAVVELGYPATVSDVRRQISSRIPSFALNNVNADLSAISVNCKSRGNYHGNNHPRRTDSGHPMDKLFKVRNGTKATFQPYKPSAHGVWELADIGEKVLRPLMIETFAEYFAGNDGDDMQGDLDQIISDPITTPTEKVALIKSRIGQGVFREKVLLHWCTCAVTGLADTTLLVASHIKPWKKSTNAERLDPWNGLLLSPNLDKAFDKGFITFEADGCIRISPLLAEADKLGITASMKVALKPEHERYMPHHRTSEFKSG